MESRAMDSLPEDMEERRLADLEKFALNHPNHPMVPLLMKQVQQKAELFAEDEVEGGESNEGSWYWLREEQLQPARKGKGEPQCRVKSGGKHGAMNKWDKASSLELLAASKRFQDTLAELSIRGIRVTSDSRWTAIAKNLPNRYGLEPAKYARSCKVHFMNLCRGYRAQSKNSKGEDAIDPQVRRALEDYFQTGDVNVPPRPPRKGIEVKPSVKGGEHYVSDMDAKYVKMTNLEPDKIHHEDKRAAMAKAAKIALEKHWKRRPDKAGNSRSREYTEGVEKISMENHDPHEQEELGHPYYQLDQRVSPRMDSGAILKRWDTASTLQLLAAVRSLGPKVVNRWEAIASQLPNHWKLDRQEYARSCKEQYRALLRIYTRENMQLDLGHKPLVDEVHAQLEKWLLSNSTTSKANHLRRREIPCEERRDKALERVAVKPAFNRGAIHENDEDGKGIPNECGVNKALERVAVKPAFNRGSIHENDEVGKGIPNNYRVDTKGKGGSAEKNHEKTGFVKPNSEMRNSNDLDHHTVGLNNGSSWNDAENLNSDADSDWELEEYRRRIKTTSSEQEREQITRNKGLSDAEDRKRTGMLQQRDDSIVGRFNKLQERNTVEAALFYCSGSNQAVNIGKTGSKDYYVHEGSHNRGRESEARRDGEFLQRAWRDPGNDWQKTKEKKSMLYDEKLKIEGTLKKQRPADAQEKGLFKPFTHRIHPDRAKTNDNKSFRDGYHLSEHGGIIERGENSKGIKRRAADGEIMTSPEFEPIEAEFGDREVSKMRGITKRITDPRPDACVKDKAPLLYDSDSNLILVAESDNVRSWDDSIRSTDSCRLGVETNSRMIGIKSPYLKEKQDTKTNISFNGKRIFSSRTQHVMGNKLLHADKREVEMNPAADQLENCKVLDRRLNPNLPPLSGKLKLDSDQDGGSGDDSMHLDEDESASEEDEAKRKRTKRLLIMNRMLKKRAERTKADNKRIGSDKHKPSAQRSTENI